MTKSKLKGKLKTKEKNESLSPTEDEQEGTRERMQEIKKRAITSDADGYLCKTGATEVEAHV